MPILFSAGGVYVLTCGVSFPFRSCTPAESLPSTIGDCQPLINLDRPFCEYYGFKLDKYVNVSVETQQYWNNQLWALQEFYRWSSSSTECLHKTRFVACYYLFPGCDRSTSKFLVKDICKESCQSYIRECSAFLKVWEEMFQFQYPGKEFPSNCFKQPLRSAGSSPECVFDARKLRSLKETGISVGNLITGGPYIEG